MHAKPGAVGQAILVQELGSSRGVQGGPPQPGQGSQSAQAARHVLQAVHTFVALTQIQQVMIAAFLFYCWPMKICWIVHPSRFCVVCQ